MFIYQFKNLPLIFIFNEKCACTTIKNIINDIDKLYENDQIKDESKRFLFAHNNPNSMFQNVKINDILKKKTHHVFFFMRNPYHRFLSGYSKIRYKSRILQRIDKSKKPEECLELINNYNINIDARARMKIRANQFLSVDSPCGIEILSKIIKGVSAATESYTSLISVPNLNQI